MSHITKIKRRKQSDFSTYITGRKKDERLHLKFFKGFEVWQRLNSLRYRS